MKKNNIRNLSVIIAAIFMLMLTACGVISKDDYSVKYFVKINPEFEVYADENLVVTRVEAVNEDAETVLSNISLIGMPVADAFNTIIEESKSEGFMTEEKGNTVSITMEDYDKKAVKVCSVCGGGGTVDCWDCHGEFKHECEECHGNITVTCEECRGTGFSNEAMRMLDANGVCTNCGGKGSVTCDKCKGEGWVTCEGCGGTGQAKNNCDQCGGTGHCNYCGGNGWQVVTNGDDGGVVYDGNGNPETGGCEACHGTGICQKCHAGNMTFCNMCCEHNGPNGEVRNPGGIPGKDRCSECDGTGTVRCKYCEQRESGNVSNEVCRRCNGQGQYTCRRCEGKGYWTCGCELNGRRWCPCCWGSGVEGTGLENYDFSLSPEANFNNAH